MHTEKGGHTDRFFPKIPSKNKNKRQKKTESKHKQAKLLPPDRVGRGKFPEESVALSTPLIAPIYAPLLPASRKVLRDVFAKRKPEDWPDLRETDSVRSANTLYPRSTATHRSLSTSSLLCSPSLFPLRSKQRQQQQQ